MTAIDQIETASPMSARRQAALLTVLVFVALMVISVCLVIGVGTASRPKLSGAREVTAACRSALGRARAADRAGSSDDAIKAAKAMLEVCRTH